MSNKIDGEKMKGVVCFLDALGTKAIWNRSDPNKTIDSWREINSALKLINEQINDILTKDNPGLNIPPNTISKYLVFSDTIIITIATESETFPADYQGKFSYIATLLITLCKIISRPFIAGLQNGIFFKGIISVGEFYQSENMIIGPAVDEAAEWYKEPEWIGVSAAPSAFFIIKNANELLNNQLQNFVEYDIPLKNNQILNKGIAWNWIEDFQKSYKVLDASGTVTDASMHRALLLDILANPIGISVFPKYENTLNFYDAVTKTIKKEGKSLTT